MSWAHYDCLEAFIEQDQVDWMGDGVLGQLVTVMTHDTMAVDPAVCALTPEEARELAFRLLTAAEHAERMTRGRGSDR